MSATLLTISLLGPFQVALEGETVTHFGADTARALLAYLAMDPGTAHRRDALAGLLWPDRPNADALRNLRMTLSRLRDAIHDREADPPFLQATRRTLALTADGDRCSADVWALREALAATEAHDHETLERCDLCAAHLTTVANLYRGEFLEGFALDSAEFEQWMVAERESLHWEVLEALSALAAYHAGRGDYDDAVAAARRQVELEPWREVAHRQWMRALALSGRRNAALAQFETCRELLSDELGVEPEATTVRLYEQIRDGIIAPPRAASRTTSDVADPGANGGKGVATPMGGAPSPPIMPPPSPTAATPTTIPVHSGASEPTLTESERRLVTVARAEITGTDKLRASVGVEDWATCLSRLLRATGAEVRRVGGRIDRYEEDGFVALFGVGAAHEDDPERATLAAMRMSKSFEAQLSRLAREVPAWRDGLVDLDLRVAVHTGEAIVTPLDTGEGDGHRAALGDATAAARRLLERVPPGEVRVSASTYGLVESLFAWASPPETEAETFRPTARIDAPNKGRGLPGMRSPLVGREAELRALRETVARARSGIGSVVTLIGEAGIGKSRLVAEAREGDGALRWVEGRCLSYGGTMAYALWISVLRALIGVTADTPASAVGRALHEHVEPLDPDDAKGTYAYVARLLAAPLDAQSEAMIAQMDGRSLQNATFRAVETLIAGAAARQPLVVVCEDLHWADATSLQLLARLLALTDHVPLAIVSLFRPRHEHGCWRIYEMARRTYPHRHLDLQLQPLSATQGETLVQNLLLSIPGPDGRRAVEGLPPELKNEILRRGEGNPFYVEEILRSLIRSGAIVCDAVACEWQASEEAESVGIPDTLYGLLRGRIDQLPSGARHVLQLASVIGRIFPHRLLAEIAEQRGLDEHLITLQREQLIRQHLRPAPRARFSTRGAGTTPPPSQASTISGNIPPAAQRVPSLVHRPSSPAPNAHDPDDQVSFQSPSNAEYIFQHQLTLEATYDGLLQRARRVLHRRVAEALERLYPERVEEQLGLRARHWEQAGDVAHAVDYLRRAAEQAAEQYANEEALAYVRRALALIPEDDLQGQFAVLAVREVIDDRRGARDAQRADLARLQEIAEALDDGSPAGKRRLAQVALREANLHKHMMDAHALIDVVPRIVRLAQAAGDKALEAAGHADWGTALHRLTAELGDWEGPEAHWEQALDLARAAEDRVAGRRIEALVLRELGITSRERGLSAETAEAYLEENLRIHRESGNRLGEGMAWNALADVYNLMHRDYEAKVCLEKGLRLCRLTGNRRDAAYATVGLGSTLYNMGRYAAAQELYREGVHLARQVGDRYCEGEGTGGLARVAGYVGDQAEVEGLANHILDLAGETSISLIVTAHLALGHAQVNQAQFGAAAENYQKAVALCKEYRWDTWGVSAHAGLARIALERGTPDAALPHVEEILDCIDADPILYGARDPMYVYLTCYEVLRAVENPRAGPLLDQAHDLLQGWAARIEDAELRRSYLENVAAHREIVAAVANREAEEV